MEDLSNAANFGIDLLIFFVLGFIMGVLAEQVANRKLLKPTILLAILIGFGGGLIGAWLFERLGNALNDPRIVDVSALPALIGAIVLLIPWWFVRSGRTPYGNKRTWQRKYRR